MAEMMFYERVVALNDKQHEKLRVRPPKNFAYAARINSVPLLANEFFEAAREYPIVFTDGQNGPLPVALLGLREAENLFVGSNGKWDARYVPAFVRRYPFVPATGDNGELLVCIDEASACFDTKSGEPLFSGGKPTSQLEHAITFLREFHVAAAGTELLGQKIKQLGLLRQADSVAKLKDGTQYRLSGLQVIDETKLRALDAPVVQEFFANGSLAVIYAHMVSLGNLAGLVDRLSVRSKATKVS